MRTLSVEFQCRPLGDKLGGNFEPVYGRLTISIGNTNRCEGGITRGEGGWGNTDKIIPARFQVENPC